MRRIDECRLTSSYQHPRLVGFRLRPGSRPAAAENWPAFTAEPVASAGRTFPSVSTAAGVVFPSWRVRTEPLTSLSPPSQGLVALARPRNRRRPPRPSRVPSRERGRPGFDPGCLPSIEDLRPATPSRAPGSGLPELHGLAAAVLPLDVFDLLRDPRGPLRRLGPRSRTPDAAGRRLPGPRRRSPTSATVTTRGHTRSSRRSSPASGGFRPHCTPAP